MLPPEFSYASLAAIKVGASADAMQFWYDEYTLAGQAIDNARAYILGLNLSAMF